MQLVTVCNTYKPELFRLYESAKHNDWPMQVLGMGRNFGWTVDKYVYMIEWLEAQPINKLILFADAFDSILMADRDEVIEKYRDFNSPLVVSGELNCWPLASLAVKHPIGPGPYRYLNSGGWIGISGYVLALLKSFNIQRGLYGDDQGLLMQAYIDRQVCAVDTSAYIFQSMYNVGLDDVVYNDKIGRVVNTITNTTPCILHGNGKSNLEPGIKYMAARGLI